VNLLDSKRSLNVNIYLHQFRVTPTELVDYLRYAVPCSKTASTTADGRRVELSLERLRGLQRILPESDDVEALKAFDGNASRLGTAEKFYLELIQLLQ